MATATPFQPPELEMALRKLAQRAPLTAGERVVVQKALDEAPAAVGDWSDVTPEEMAELERAAADAETSLAEGRGIPAEKFFADRGIPYPPTAG
jgi:hypothetical protein